MKTQSQERTTIWRQRLLAIMLGLVLTISGLATPVASAKTVGDTGTEGALTAKVESAVDAGSITETDGLAEAEDALEGEEAVELEAALGALDAALTPDIQPVAVDTDTAPTLPTPITAYIGLPDGCYSFYTSDGYYLEVPEASTKKNVQLQLYKGNGHIAQKFQLSQTSQSSDFSLRNCYSVLYLSVKNSEKKSSAVVQKSYTDLSSQQFRLEIAEVINGVVNGNGPYYLKSTTGAYLTVKGSPGNCAKIVTTNDKSKALKWNVKAVKQPSVSIGASGYYSFYTQKGLYLDIPYASTTNGTPLQLYKGNGNVAQIFKVNSSSKNTYFYAVNCNAKRSWDIDRQSTKNGTIVQQWDYVGAKSQKFTLVPAGSGWYYLMSGIGTYLTVNGTPENCSKIVTTNDMSKALKWRYKAVEKPVKYIGTYIDVNLSTQKCMIIENGNKVFECDVVTGRSSMATPTGTFYIMTKIRHANLRGPTWNSWVDYWAQFTSNGCGFHDASWQSSFGLKRWLAGYGSHGCVNMPYASAKQFYGMIHVGEKVVVHR